MTKPTVHYFSALKISLPRLELERRNQYIQAKKLHYDLAPQIAGRDSARLCLEDVSATRRKANKVADGWGGDDKQKEELVGPTRAGVRDREVPSAERFGDLLGAGVGLFDVLLLGVSCLSELSGSPH